MIGRQEITVEIHDATGDRREVSVRVVGPGDTDWTFPISISRTLQAIWGIPDDEIEGEVRELARGIAGIRGTASAPPTAGYVFDSYNSEDSISETLNKIRNLGIELFLKDRGAHDEIAAIFGGSLLTELERLNALFVARTGMRLVRPLDYAFEASEATTDLSTEPKDKADFLYRICILSVIVDAFGIRRDSEERGVPSLKALTNWLAERVGTESARRMTAAFARVKDLRKQYPVHEHFEQTPEGQRRVRSELRAAHEFFGFKPHWDYATMWKAVSDRFGEALRGLEAHITDQDVP